MSGDCFVVAGQLIVDLPPGAWLCHGQPRYRGKTNIETDHRTGETTLVETGDRYWHAWVETATTVFDFSNGKELVVAIEAFYVAGQIDRFHVRRYTYEQAATLMRSTGHYGPWDPTPGSSQTAHNRPGREHFPNVGRSAPERQNAPWTGRSLADVVQEICDPELQNRP